MMVDTINPNTNEPEQPNTAASPTQSQGSEVASDRFYGGFDKPDEVNINLASTSGQKGDELTDLSSAEPPVAKEVAPSVKAMNDMTPPSSQTSSSSVESQTHNTYSNKAPINSRGILVIVGVGIIATLIFSIGTYLLLSSSNAAKLREQQSRLDELNQRIAGLSEMPVALTVPEVIVPEEEEPEVVETPVVEPVETPAVKSTETEVPQRTNDNGDSSAQAAG